MFSRSTTNVPAEATSTYNIALVPTTCQNLAGGLSIHETRVFACLDWSGPAGIEDGCEWMRSRQPGCPILRQSSRAPWAGYQGLH